MMRVLRIATVVFVSVLFVRLFLIDSFLVAGDSMAPAILPNDYVFINKFAYRFNKAPQREDIVILTSPKIDNEYIIKRVIALPRERIVIENGTIYIKDSREGIARVLEEQYLAIPDTPAIGITYINMDPQEYFVLGDNRQMSIDSRELGSINKWEIKGKVFLAIRIENGFKIFWF